MSLKKEKSLLKQIDSLSQENKCLKRQVKKLRGVVDKVSLPLEKDSYEEEIEFEENNKCICGGELKKVQIFKYLFEICQVCKLRKRIK